MTDLRIPRANGEEFLIGNITYKADKSDGAGRGKINIISLGGAGAVTIQSISPTSASFGQTLTITVDNAFYDVSYYKVEFPGLTGPILVETGITRVNATTLTVVIPQDAADGAITLISDGNPSVSPQALLVSPFEPEVGAIITGIEARGGTVPTAERVPINNLILALKSRFTSFSNVLQLYGMMGGVLNAHQMNWANPGTYDLVYQQVGTGAAIATAKGIELDIPSNNNTAYFEMGLDWRDSANPGISDTYTIFWVVNASPAATFYFFGAAGSGIGNTATFSRRDSSTIRAAANAISGSQQHDVGPLPAFPAVIILSKDNANPDNSYLMINGSTYDIKSGLFGTPFTNANPVQMLLFAANNNNTGQLLTSAAIADGSSMSLWGMVSGEILSEAEAQGLTADIQTWMAALGRDS